MRPYYLIGSIVIAAAAAIGQQQNVTIHRDNHGVPHVFATSDRGAFYGAGYAAAQDRLFQMAWFRLRYQGRTAEFFGAGNGADPKLYIKYDIGSRTLGFARHAQRVFQNLPVDEKVLLQHYADGVNQAVADGVTMHPLFTTWNVTWTPWEPADCIGVWYQFAEMFQGRDFAEVTNRATVDDWFANHPHSTPQEVAQCWLDIANKWNGNSKYDDAVASVQQGDVPLSVQNDMATFAATYGVPIDRQARYGVYSPSFSEAVALGGSKVDTGHSVLVGMPRVDLKFPNVFQELHMVGRNFNVRGACLAGSPFVLFGSTSYCAWSATKLGMDMSDLFLLEPSPSSPDEYMLDGVSTKYAEEAVETILVNGGSTEFVMYRRSHWGPVVTDLTDDVPAGMGCALKGVPFDRDDTCDLTGFLAMYKAKKVSEFYAATQYWRFPSANLVFAGPNGTTGATVIGAMPVRARGQEIPGQYALDGNTTANDWQLEVPHNLRPYALNPARGYTMNGNSLPVGSWYPMKALIPGLGDTNRSRVLRDIVERTPVFQESKLLSFAPQGSLQNVPLRNPFVQSAEVAFTRDIVELGLHLQSVNHPLSADATSALLQLAPWLQNGALLDTTDPGAAVAQFVNQALMDDPQFPSMAALIPTYGGRQSGMSLWLREARRGISLPPPLTRQLPQEEASAIDELLADAWRGYTAAYQPASGQSQSMWYEAQYLTSAGNGGGVPALLRWTIPVDGHGPLQTPANTVPYPGRIQFGPQLCRAGDALADLNGSSFNQVVPLGNPDESQSLLALGQSEHDASPYQLDQKPLWDISGLKPSPMTLARLQSLGITSTVVKTIP